MIIQQNVPVFMLHSLLRLQNNKKIIQMYLNPESCFESVRSIISLRQDNHNRIAIIWLDNIKLFLKSEKFTISELFLMKSNKEEIAKNLFLP